MTLFIFFEVLGKGFFQCPPPSTPSLWKMDMGKTLVAKKVTNKIRKVVVLNRLTIILTDDGGGVCFMSF